MTRTPHRLGRITALAAALIVGLTACGGSDSTDDSTGGNAAAPAADTAATAEALTAAYAGEFGDPPTTPTTPKKGVSVWVVSCGEQVPSCADPTAGAVEAAELAGWDATVCDGKLNPDGWGTCVRQATSADADVLLPIGIDCGSLQQPFQEAKDAGVTVIGAGGADCDASGGQALWGSERLQLADTDIQQYWELNGKLAADWLIGTSGGTAQVLQLQFTDPVWGPWLTQGFADQIATCSGCSVVATLDIANSDVGGGTLATKFSTALLQNPDVDSVFVPVGGWMSAGLAQAVSSSGRSADLKVISEFGPAGLCDLIRSDGGLDAVVGYPDAWGSYGSIDTAIRVLNGEQPLVQGDGIQIVDADHNLPPAGKAYQPEVDFKAAYKAAWGV